MCGPVAHHHSLEGYTTHLWRGNGSQKLSPTPKTRVCVSLGACRRAAGAAQTLQQQSTAVVHFSFFQYLETAIPCTTLQQSAHPCVSTVVYAAIDLLLQLQSRQTTSTSTEAACNTTIAGRLRTSPQRGQTTRTYEHEATSTHIRDKTRISRARSNVTKPQERNAQSFGGLCRTKPESHKLVAMYTERSSFGGLCRAACAVPYISILPSKKKPRKTKRGEIYLPGIYVRYSTRASGPFILGKVVWKYPVWCDAHKQHTPLNNHGMATTGMVYHITILPYCLPLPIVTTVREQKLGKVRLRE